MDSHIKSKTKKKGFKPDKVINRPGEVCPILEYTRKDREGNVRLHVVRKAESYVKQFMQLLLVQMSLTPENAPLQIRDTANTIKEIALGDLNFAANALVNIDTHGILVGTGSAAPTINNYSMETKIANGTGAGQLQYSAMTFGLPTSSLTFSHFTCTRDFSNSSGNTITINEIGLVVQGQCGEYWSQSGTARGDTGVGYFLIIRDVIVGGVDVFNGETLTVNYRQQATV